MANISDYYEWLKALHIIFVISWMVGLLYLPRLYVYHADTETGSQQDKTFQVMERKLLRYIMNPAMIITLILGILLTGIIQPFSSDSGIWFHIKALLLVFLFGFHGYLAKIRKDFERGNNQKPVKFFRILNEVPTVLMILIVCLAILKP